MKSFCTVALIMAAAARLAAAEPVADAAAEKLGWQLAVHSYSFRKFSIEEAIDNTAALGIHYMSLSGSVRFGETNVVKTTELTDAQQTALLARLSKAGIKLVNIGVVQLPANEAASRRVFEAAKKLGVDTLVAEPAPDALDVVEKLCREFQIRVAIHNHPKPSRYWNPDTVLAALKGRSPWLGACADTGHWIRSGLDPLECLKKLDGHVLCLHFKDLAERSPQTHDVPWGTGVANSKALLEELQRQRFKGAICVEYEYHWDNSVPEIAECAKFFNVTVDSLPESPVNFQKHP